METFDIVLIASSLGGIIMVLGGILLLYKGAISLSNVSGEEGFTFEFKRELRISTQYPALGIFIIGLLFVALPVLTGKPEFCKLTVKGKAVNVSEPISLTLKASSWKSSMQHTGEVLETFYPNVDTIQIVVSAPGYKSQIKTVQISSLKDGMANLGDIKLSHLISKEEVTGEKITPLPSNVSLPPITAKPRFGGSE